MYKEEHAISLEMMTNVFLDSTLSDFKPGTLVSRIFPCLLRAQQAHDLVDPPSHPVGKVSLIRWSDFRDRSRSVNSSKHHNVERYCVTSFVPPNTDDLH